MTPNRRVRQAFRNRHTYRGQARYVYHVRRQARRHVRRMLVVQRRRPKLEWLVEKALRKLLGEDYP